MCQARLGLAVAAAADWVLEGVEEMARLKEGARPLSDFITLPVLAIAKTKLTVIRGAYTGYEQ